MHNFQPIQAATPDILLRATLKSLAEKVGGYDNGDDFLDLWDDLTDAHDPELVANAVGAVRALVNCVRGASAMIRLAEEAETTLVGDEDEDDDEEDNFEGVTFVSPPPGEDVDPEENPDPHGATFILRGDPRTDADTLGALLTLALLANAGDRNRGAGGPNFGINI